MGCCFGHKDEHHRQIEKHMRHEKNIEKRTRKLLLLGAGSSGKSTMLKQMKFLYFFKGDFPDSERMHYKQTVMNNIVTIMFTLCKATKDLKIHTSDENRDSIERILNIDLITEVLDDYTEDIRNCWGDRGIKQAYYRRAELVIYDNCTYFMDRENLDRMLQADYVPTFQDVVRTRVKTTGIHFEEFVFEGPDGGKPELYKICDVGGQRTERSKWIKCFDDVVAVMFVIALSGYDQVLYEDGHTNRMDEALELFRTTCSEPVFEEINFIVFLNKLDLFTEKIKTIPFNQSFAVDEYMSDPHDPDECIAFLEEEIQKRDNHPRTYFHVTQATDSENVHRVFAFCHDIILRGALGKGGLL